MFLVWNIAFIKMFYLHEVVSGNDDNEYNWTKEDKNQFGKLSMQNQI